MENEEIIETVLSDLKKKGLYEAYLKRMQAGDPLNGSIQVSPGVLVDGKKIKKNEEKLYKRNQLDFMGKI